MAARSGFSLVEVMVTLVLLGVGVLGGLGSIALAWRTARNGERLAASGRRVEIVLDSLRMALVAGGGRCGLLTSGRDSSAAGIIEWRVASASGGVALTLELTYATLPPSRDTGWTFLACSS